MSINSIDEYDSDEDVVEVITTHDYVTEARQIIYDHDDITIENALLLNKQLQTNLQALRARLEQMLSACQHKYNQNEEILTNLTKVNTGPAKARRTYYFCGYPYFKNRHAFGAPPPADYAERYKQKKELFPMQLEGRSLWTAASKVHLIQAVKKQVIKFLQTKNRDRIRAFTAKRSEDVSEQIKMLMQENNVMVNKQLAELYATAVAEKIKIDWFSISASDLRGQHTMNECIGMWYGYLMPSLNRSQWTPSEEDELLHFVNSYSMQNWSAIAKHLNRRSPYQCFVHYHAVLSEKHIAKNVKWTKEEDAHLIEMVEKYRIGDIIPWTKILESMPGRYKAQIYNRYMFSLNPSIKRDRFSVEEDCILMAAVEEYGTHFQNFPSHLLPGRNFVQIRNRYNNVLRHNGKVQHWTIDDDQKLVDLVEKYGNKDWARIANEIEVHSRLSCRSRYNTIVKFLQQHPKATIADVTRRKRKFSSKVTTSNWMETIIRAKQKDQLPDETAVALQNERKEKRLIGYINNDLGYEYYRYFKYSYNFHLSELKAVPNSTRLRTLALLLGSNTSFDARLHERVSSDFLNLKKLPQAKLEQSYIDYVRNSSTNDIRLPPNLRTVLGFRGLTIMFDCQEDILLENASRKSSEDPQQSKPAPVKANVKQYKSKASQNNLSKPIDVIHCSDTTGEDSILSIPSAPLVRPISLVRRQTPEEAIQLFKKRFKALFYTTALLANVSPVSMTEAAEPQIEIAGPSHLVSAIRKRKAIAANEGTSENVEQTPVVKKQHLSDEETTNYTIETEAGVYRITMRDENDLECNMDAENEINVYLEDAYSK